MDTTGAMVGQTPMRKLRHWNGGCESTKSTTELSVLPSAAIIYLQLEIDLRPCSSNYIHAAPHPGCMW